jgi:hypothetical protein
MAGMMGMTVEEYAKNKLALQREGELELRRLTMEAETPRARGRPKVNKFQAAAQEIAAEQAVAPPVEMRKEIRPPMREEEGALECGLPGAPRRFENEHVGSMDEGTGSTSSFRRR